MSFLRALVDKSPSIYLVEINTQMSIVIYYSEPNVASF